MCSLINKSELIAKDIEYQILQNNYAKLLPSERKLAQKYNVSRNTIRESLEILQNKHLITLNSKHYEVAEPNEDYDWLETFSKGSNHKLTNYIIKNTVLEANKKMAQQLKIPLATPVRHISYKRITAGTSAEKIISLDSIYVPESFAQKLSLKDLKSSSFFTLLAQKFEGKAIKEYQSLSIESVTTTDAKLLKIPVRTKILRRNSLFFIEKIPIYFISKKIPSTALLMQIDTNFKTHKDNIDD